jgi:hypothetical protein
LIYAWVFGGLAVVVNRMVFSNPAEGDEHGVRLEIRVVEDVPHRGSTSASQPIVLNDAVWRADIFESVVDPTTSFDRAHFHPMFRRGEPVDRQWDSQLTEDPYSWLDRQLGDLQALLVRAEYPDLSLAARDGGSLKQAVPEILQTVKSLWSDIRAGSDPRAFG